ncbi:hypothetical protein GCM10020295_20080 [Streptomyces cinereospinus]
MNREVPRSDPCGAIAEAAWRASDAVMKYTPVGFSRVLGAGRSGSPAGPLAVQPCTTEPLEQQSSSTSLEAARQDWSIRSRNSAGTAVPGRSAGSVSRVRKYSWPSCSQYSPCPLK